MQQLNINLQIYVIRLNGTKNKQDISTQIKSIKM